MLLDLHQSNRRRVAAVLIALSAALPFGRASAALQGEPNTLAPEHQRAHFESVARERLARIRDEWRAAPPERAAAVTDLFHRHRRPYERASAAPPPQAVSEALRILAEGPREAARAPWQRQLVDALDLRVRPGAFEARAEGPGEALIVRVQPLHEVLASSTLSLSLHWISPSGAEERARTEPIDPSAWTAQGFDMYIRPPASSAGRWKLVAEVAHEDQRWRGMAVPVDCVDRLHERARELAARMGSDASPAAAELGPRVARWLEVGLRSASPLPFEAWLDLALGDLSSPDALGPVPVVMEDPSGKPALLWSFSDAPRDPAAPVFLVATHGAEHPLELLTGAVGAEWRELAHALGAALFASEVPPLGEAGDATLLELLHRLGATRQGAELVLVLRGDAGVLFPTRLRREGVLGIDRLVLCGPPGGGARPELRLALPVLAIDAFASRDERLAGGGDAPWTWIRHREPAFLVELLAPDEIGAWIAGPDGRERTGR